jgi:glucose/arabinose dehydrogenase/regulation of enolase protein 1 (concanavalin A-like superfamily)
MKPFLFSTLLFILFNVPILSAQTYPPGFSKVEVASDMLNPTAMVFAPDGRIFVCQQNGALIVIKNGLKLPTPAIKLTVSTAGERGLVGIALHPSFSTNGIIYLYYTLPDGTRNRVSRFSMSGDVINPTSEQIIYDLDRLSSSPYHNGGAMQFLGDKLFIAVGDNSSGSNAQNLETTKGKILRVNANGSVPGDNPFYSSTGSRQRNSIWAYGFRNPFTFDIQPGTNRIFVNDVGQEGWEEVNDVTAKGNNFGWPSTEGKTTNPLYTSPYYAYAHGTGDGVGCAITGGVFFNPSNTNYPPQYVGKYFFQDYCNSWINYIDVVSPTPSRTSFVTGNPGQSLAIDVGNDGNLYFLTRAGKLFKIVYNISQPPVITDQPDNVSVPAGQTATFNVSAAGANPIKFQWKKNNIDIPGATSASFTIANCQPSDAGSYSVYVSNAFGNVTSDAATLTVTESNSPPTSSIILPASGTTYRGGDIINFSGDASDPEEGILDASAFSWSIEFHHDQHFHDSPPIAQGVKNGSYTIPASGETAINVFYRLILTVTDAQGLTHSSFVDLAPNISIMTLRSNPPGLTMTMDGQPFVTPVPIRSVEGVQRTIGITSPQTLNGVTHVFSGWAQGGPPSQTLATPIDNTTYTANFSKPLIPPWNTTDIGKLNIFGNASVSEDVFTLSASGRDIYNNDDHFRFVYQDIAGDCDIRARVTSISNTNVWAKAGVMIRESLEPNSKHAMMIVSPVSGTSFQRRTTTGGSTTATNGTGAAPYWLRMVRSGNAFSAFTSPDGSTWTPVGTPQSISMGSTVHVGLVVTSHNSNALCTATMTNVSVFPSIGATAFSMPEVVTIAADNASFKVYPNPLGGTTMYFELNSDDQLPAKVQVINVMGQILLEHKIDSPSTVQLPHALPMENIPKGLYFIRVISRREVSSTSFVKE